MKNCASPLEIGFHDIERGWPYQYYISILFLFRIEPIRRQSSEENHWKNETQPNRAEITLFQSQFWKGSGLRVQSPPPLFSCVSVIDEGGHGGRRLIRRGSARGESPLSLSGVQIPREGHAVVIEPRDIYSRKPALPAAADDGVHFNRASDNFLR